MSVDGKRATDDAATSNFFANPYTFSIGAYEKVYIFSGNPVEAYHFYKQLKAQSLGGCFIHYMFGGDASDFCRAKYDEHFAVSAPSVKTYT